MKGFLSKRIAFKTNVIGLEKCAVCRAHPCGIIRTGNFTGWGSERVNSELVPTRVVGHSVKAPIDSDGAMVRQE